MLNQVGSDSQHSVELATASFNTGPAVFCVCVGGALVRSQ